MKIRDMVQELLESVGSRQTLLEPELKGLLCEVGIGVPKGVVVPLGGTAPAGLDQLRYPLVAKVISPRIISKSDVGGVRLGIGNYRELQLAVAELSRLDHAEGVLVEEMAPAGFEVIVGATVDVEFGPIVMFGLGGLFVELFRDMAFALAPLTEKEALWLVNETKGTTVLKGFRGKPPLDIDALLKIIVLVAELIATGFFREIDLNPVVLYPSGALVVDAKMGRSNRLPVAGCREREDRGKKRPAGQEEDSGG